MCLVSLLFYLDLDRSMEQAGCIISSVAKISALVQDNWVWVQSKTGKLQGKL